MRKPRPLMFGKWKVAFVEWAWVPSPRIDIDLAYTDDPREIERLAAWLIKAAAWLREQEEK